MAAVVEIYIVTDWESLAGSVIQATGAMKFEDGLRTAVLFGDYVVTALTLGSISIPFWSEII